MQTLSTVVGIILASATALLRIYGITVIPIQTLDEPDTEVMSEKIAEPSVTSPLPNIEERPRLLTFGLYVTPDPARNPIDPPERFTGYHTALDFEILPGEERIDVPVFAMCDGTVLFRDAVDGYGGMFIQSCMLNDQPVTVLYGHLRIDSLPRKNTAVKQGDPIALLAPAYSRGSDDTRKHLHIGIHKGTQLEFLGYAQDAKRLEEFIDPASLLFP